MVETGQSVFLRIVGTQIIESEDSSVRWGERFVANRNMVLVVSNPTIGLVRGIPEIQIEAPVSVEIRIGAEEDRVSLTRKVAFLIVVAGVGERLAESRKIVRREGGGERVEYRVVPDRLMGVGPLQLHVPVEHRVEVMLNADAVDEGGLVAVERRGVHESDERVVGCGRLVGHVPAETEVVVLGEGFALPARNPLPP